MNYIIASAIIAIYPCTMFIKNIMQNRFMNSILSECQMQHDEVLIVLTESFECPIHQCQSAEHYNDCKNIGKNERVIGLYDNNKYIAIACKENARFIVADKFKYIGKYKHLRERVGSGEWAFSV
jgi:hypothetical protein